MIAVPFIYFSLLASYLYVRKRRVDISLLICAIYAVSSFFSILSYVNGITEFGLAKHEISSVAAFMYCFLLTLCLLPFISFSNNNIKQISPVKNEKFLKSLAWIAFVWFLITLFFSFGTFYNIITGDLAAIRAALYNGDDEISSYTINLPFPIPVIFTILNVIFNTYWILIFLAFFSLVIQKLPLKYFLMYLFASLSGPWTSVLGLDRSGFAYYILATLLIFLFFKPFMSRQLRKNISLVMLIIIGIAVAYLSMVTVSRFEGAEDGSMSGAQVGLLSYFGQSYINFCYFFDTFESPFTTLNLIFPFTNKYILGDKLVGGTMLNEYIANKTNQPLGVFYTYLGNILVTAGRVTMILFSFCYCFILYRIFPKLIRTTTSPVLSAVYIFSASFMVLGLFTYYYSTPYRTFSCIVMFYIIWRMGYLKLKLK